MKKITFIIFLLTTFLGYSQDPATAPTTPTKAAVDVISVYSDAYTSVATNLNPGWGQATAQSEIQISSNNIMKYANLNYQGLEYTNPTDVSAMEYVHLDYYTTDATAFQFFLIAGGENAYDIAATDGITTGQWVSLDIPLSFYSDAGRNLAAAFQFKTVGNGTLYLDNIYFWKAPAAAGTDTSLSDLTVDGTTISGFGSLSTSYSIELAAGTTTVPTVVATTTDTNATNQITNATSLPGTTTILVTAQDGTTTNTVTINFTLDPTPATNAPTPTQNSADVISVYSDTYTSNATNLNPGWGQATAFSEIQISSNNILKYANLNYQGMEYTSSDVSAMEYVHLDYYTSDATAFQFFLIAGGENAYDIAATDGITTGQWVSLDIPLSHYSNAGRNLAAAIQFKTVGNGTIFLDNIYFWKANVNPLTDATLSDLTVDGTTVSGFSAETTTYDVELTAGTTVVPTVVGTATQSSPATAVTTAASSLPGSSTVLVTAQDGTTEETYTINFTVATPITAPTTAAPTPPARNAADVVSIYSDAYAAISPINYDEQWCGADAMTATTADGDNIFAYNDKPCQGIGFAGDPQDVSGLTNLHVDLYIATGTDLVGKVFNVKIVYSAGGEITFPIDINALSPAPVPGTWYSYDAEVNIEGSNIQQVGITSNLNNIVWYDNLYFWKETVNPLTDATLSDLQVDGTTVTDFSSDQISYSVVLPKGTTTIPQITLATKSQNGASTVITQAAQLPGDATVVVTSEDTSIQKTYTISFSVDTNTPCSGNSSEAAEGTYSVGYNYTFETLETGNQDVKITFELLDQDKTGFVPQVFIAPSTFINMTNESGQIYTATLTDQTGDIEFSIRGAYAGGLVRSKVFEYTVGDNCESLSIESIENAANISKPCKKQYYYRSRQF
ncbi:hypothetical protein ACFLRU_07155 [Bacteroidota bacterium]